MDENIKNHRNGLKIAAIVFSGLLLSANVAYSHGGGHGGGHHGGGHHGGGHHGGGHHGWHGGGHHGWHGGGWRGAGWGGGGWGWGGGYYGVNVNPGYYNCWVPAHYNRYGNYIPGHRRC